MPSAIIGESVASLDRVDPIQGVVYGCRLAEVNRVATFAGLDGKPRNLLITPKLVDELLALCQAEERLSAHWTHKWATGEEDALLSRVAAWRNFRKDEIGNLIADAFTYPGEKREAILHAAENDPRGIMVSMVFGYDGEWNAPSARDVRAADFVGKGACTTALCTAVLSALDKTHTAIMADPTDPPVDPTPDPEPAEQPVFSDEQIAALKSMLQEWGLLPPDEAPQEAAPAIMSAVSAHVETILKDGKKLAVLAQAAGVRSVGAKPAPVSFSAPVEKKNPLQENVAVLMAAGTSKPQAILTSLRKDPSWEQYRSTVN